MSGLKEIHIQYFAMFREARGLGTETLTTPCQNLLELYQWLKTQYGFTLDPSQVGVSLNRVFTTMDAVLSQGDEVVFIPPVAGG
ncbi:MAG: MoaD/ThiS family protein [Cyanobacteria bacterium]|nr:MoaD/ThiS family protein [Cyanobacteriota bacterium]